MTCTQSFLGGLFWKWYRDGWGRTSNRETAWSANIYWPLAMCQLYKDGFGFCVVLRVLHEADTKTECDVQETYWGKC